MSTEAFLYSVNVYRLIRGKRVRVDQETFPVGLFAEVGYWLDDKGYIDTRYAVEIKMLQV